jgi:AcrR family transcriptional regulator
MSGDVKPKRKYNSGRRAEQAAQTRDAVVSAARAQFIAAGWQATTVAGIANAAGVSQETIYAVFGSKQNLLQAVLERAVRRDQAAVPLLEQPGPRAILGAGSHREQITLFTRDITGVLQSVAELVSVVRAAASSDLKMTDLYQNLHDARRRNLAFVAKALLARGDLKEGMDENQATTVIWRLASPELFLLITQVEKSSSEQYADWLSAQICAALLPT